MVNNCNFSQEFLAWRVNDWRFKKYSSFKSSPDFAIRKYFLRNCTSSRAWWTRHHKFLHSHSKSSLKTSKLALYCNSLFFSLHKYRQWRYPRKTHFPCDKSIFKHCNSFLQTLCFCQNIHLEMSKKRQYCACFRLLGIFEAIWHFFTSGLAFFMHLNLASLFKLPSVDVHLGANEAPRDAVRVRLSYSSNKGEDP